MKLLNFLGLILFFTAIFSRVEKKHQKFLSKTRLPDTFYMVIENKDSSTKVGCYMKILNENIQYTNIGIPFYGCGNKVPDFDPAPGKTYAIKNGNSKYFIYLWKYLVNTKTLCSTWQDAGNDWEVNASIFPSTNPYNLCEDENTVLFRFNRPYLTDLPQEYLRSYGNELVMRLNAWRSRVITLKKSCLNKGYTYVQQTTLAKLKDEENAKQLPISQKCVSDGKTLIAQLQGEYTKIDTNISKLKNEMGAVVSKIQQNDMTIAQCQSVIEKTNATNIDLQKQLSSGTVDVGTYQKNVDNAKEAFDSIMDTLIQALEIQTDIATAAKTAITGANSADLKTFNSKMALIWPLVEAESKAANEYTPSRRRRRFK
jgi:hypothetical protein